MQTIDGAMFLERGLSINLFGLCQSISHGCNLFFSYWPKTVQNSSAHKTLWSKIFVLLLHRLLLLNYGCVILQIFFLFTFLHALSFICICLTDCFSLSLSMASLIWTICPCFSSGKFCVILCIRNTHGSK